MYVEKQYSRDYCVVDVSADSILFYTYPRQGSRPYTTLWKYDTVKKELRECFTFRGFDIRLWRDGVSDHYLYVVRNKYMIGKISNEGNKVWELKLNGYISDPVLDETGNIYISVQGMWIYCINADGSIKWRWKPEFVSGSQINLSMGIYPPKILNQEIYIFAAYGFYILSEDGKTQKCFNMPAYSMKWRLSIIGDKIIFYDKRKVVCCNLRGESMWEYDTEKYIIGILFDCYNNIYVKLKDYNVKSSVKSKNTENEGWLLSINNKGGKRWISAAGCMSIQSMVYSDEVILICDGKAEDYSLSGKRKWDYQIKGYIIWLMVMEETIISISESRGHIFVNHSLKNKGSEINSIRITKEITQGKEVKSKIEWDRWKKHIAEYIERNIDVWLKYHITGKLSAIKIYYEIAERITLELCIDGEWYKVQYGNIECDEKVTEENRDEHKECRYLDTIWCEFYNDGGEGNEERVMKEVSKILEDKYHTDVSIVEGVM